MTIKRGVFFCWWRALPSVCKNATSVECNKAKRNATRFACTCLPWAGVGVKGKVGGDWNLLGTQMPLPRPLYPGQTLPNSCTTMKSQGSFIPQAGDPATLSAAYGCFYVLITSLCTEDSILAPILKPLQKISFPLILGSWPWNLSEKQIHHSPNFSQ